MVVPLEEYDYFLPLTQPVTTWLITIAASTRLLLTKVGYQIAFSDFVYINTYKCVCIQNQIVFSLLQVFYMYTKGICFMEIALHSPRSQGHFVFPPSS